MPLSSSDFLHLPAAILGDEYADSIATWIDEAADLEPDDEAVQKNIVTYRYWESVTNKLMLEPAIQGREYESDEFTDLQLSYVNQQMLKAEKAIPADILASMKGITAYFQAVY